MLGSTALGNLLLPDRPLQLITWAADGPRGILACSAAYHTCPRNNLLLLTCNSARYRAIRKSQPGRIIGHELVTLPTPLSSREALLP